MRYIFFIAVIILINACSKNEEVKPVDLGHNFMPVQIGATWVYTIDSFAYDDNAGFTTIDTFTYLYKEQITGTFTDVTGHTAQLISRYYKLADTLDWMQANTWQLLKNELTLQRVEENTRFVKMVFPLAENKRWNGNMYNALGEEEYKVLSYDKPMQIGNTLYNQTMWVQHKDEENFISEIKQYEIFARNIGMVYRLSDSLNTQVNGSRGFRLRHTLNSYTP
jgi:hypothetical protein